MFGLACIIFYFGKHKINSHNDLIEIIDCLRDYSFYEHKGFRNHTYNYYIYLNNYNNKFQITADNIEWRFDKTLFLKRVRIGDTLTMTIPKFKKLKLNDGSKIELFSIKLNGINFLNEDDSISTYNTEAPLYMSGLLFLIAYAIYYKENKKKNE